MGWRAEARELHQQWYGWYCNSARQQDIKPVSYEEWEKQGCPKKYKKQINTK